MKRLISKTKEHVEKHFPRVLATLAVLILALGLVKVTSLEKNTEKREVASDTDSVLVPSEEPKTYCFYRLQEATSDAPYAVQEHVMLTFVAGSVTGTKSGTQSGPDMTNGYEGTLAGEVKDNEIEVVFSYTIEGSNQKELEIYEMRSEWLVKKRWPLTERGDMLVPNEVEDPTLIVYKPKTCA